ncbi:MAG: hypothetical protein HY553_22005 [Elusimicrobia bacterium]|nr:hypothetical protein [Elusimicrobiota bacterium]
MIDDDTPERASDGGTGRLVVMAFVFVNAGFALLVWQRWQQRPEIEQTIAEEGRPLLILPPPSDPVSPEADIAALAPETSFGGETDLRSAVRSVARSAPLPGASASLYVPPAAGRVVRAAASAPSAASIDPQARARLPAATEFYRRLKRRPAYVALAKAWTEEFVKHKELRRLNHRYHQDRDAAAFLLGAVRSPEFLTLLGAFAARADFQGFIRDMMASTDVSRSAAAFMKDGKVADAIGRVHLAGIPLAQIGAAASRR